jgi:toxin secretion/phage lysis holin
MSLGSLFQMNPREFEWGVVGAAAGTIVSAWLGGWDVALQALVAFMVVDYLTGVLAAVKQRRLNSEVMFWGGLRKGIILLVVAMAVILDRLVGNEDPIFRTLAIYFYVAREGLSILENLGLLGIPLPDFLRRVLEQLNDDKNQNVTKG